MKYLQTLKMPSDVTYDYFDSPVDCLTIFSSPKSLYGVFWDNYMADAANKKFLKQIPRVKQNKCITQVKQQLLEYFNGERKHFDISIVLNGTTFQKQAWQQLCKIPYGETISYGEQARRLGDANKARAIGLANGANPISIIVPCHRVIGANGQLTGFGGGVDKKAYLLELENADV